MYAPCGDASVAYRVCGDGPGTLVLIMDWFSHVEEMWLPASPLRPVLDGCAAFSRLVTFDRRGVGLSDAVAFDRLPALEEWMHDVDAVMDACGIDNAAIVAKGSGGAMGVLFAAAHPERVSSLVLVNSYARLTQADDYPIGISIDDREQLLRYDYPSRGSARILAGGEIDDVVVAWWDRYLHYSASPGMTRAMRRMLFSVDVRAVLPSVRTPTLVLHRRADRYIDVAHGRYLAEHIPGARFVELPGASDLLFAGDPSDLLAEIEEFLTGSRPRASANRVLSTVLYTDLVGSTDRVAHVGDRAWRAALDQHEHTVRAELVRYNGREIRPTGDGFLAVFDGPARAIRCAQAIRGSLGAIGLGVRAGLHTGEIELRGDDIGGIAVHIGARIAALAEPDEILTSRTVKDLVVGSGIAFSDRGVHTLKGVPDEWHLFAARP
jgi:pimeloyl-ACP methyl ester carboxylesterase